MSSLLKTNIEIYRIKKLSSVEDIFSVNNYNGTSSSNNSVITGLNMTSGDYFIKIKNKESHTEHAIYDTLRDVKKELNINKSSESNLVNGLISFNDKGFVVNDSKNINQFSDNYVVTAFKKTEKFFDIVQYTGDGTAEKTVSHSLSSEVGMIWVKALDVYSNWIVRHKDAIGELKLNESSTQDNIYSHIKSISTTNFKVANDANLLGIKYIAYLFAHDASYNGKIQCGSYIGGTTLVTNTVKNTGKILIPDEVNTVTITCRGGTGGNNIWYDPGLPYIAAKAEQPYVAPVYAWQYVSDYSIESKNAVSLEVWNNYLHTKPAPPVAPPTKVSDVKDPSTVVYVGWWTGTPEKPVFWSGHYSGYLVVEEQPFIAAIEGQEYKAPTSGGGIFEGAASTFTLNEITYSFKGGMGGQAMPETKQIDLINSKNKTLEYNIAEGGSLVYTYRIGGQTEVNLNYALPPIRFSTNLVGKGSLIIPIEIGRITIVGSGGVGFNDAWSDPGQPYVAPTAAIDQRGLPQYPDGLPIYVKAVTGVVGQGNAMYPTGLPKYVAPRDAVAAVAQKGLPAYPHGLPPYQPASAGGAGQVGLPAYPGGLPVYVAGKAAVGNASFPSGLPAYSAGPPVVGDPAYPSGLPAYVAGTVAIGEAAYPNGLPPYVAGSGATEAVGEAAYPNGLPAYVAAVSGVSSVAQQGLPEYPNGLPYYIAAVTEVIGQGKPLYPDGLEPFIAAIPATPGQLYKPPTSGGGDNFGVDSSIFIYNKSFKFPASYGVKPAQEITQYVLLSKNSVQTLEYDIPQSGKLNVSYDIPNYDNTLESTFEPTYLIIKKLTGNGEWYEIDCRDENNVLKLNKTDPVVFNYLVEIKKNGFTAVSDPVNEMNQHYAYIAIRK